MDGTVNPWLDWIVASVRSHILRSYSNGRMLDSKSMRSGFESLGTCADIAQLV
jgi:hypothetical protein